MAAPASTQSAEPQINAPFSKQTNSLMVWLIVPIYLAGELRSRSEKKRGRGSMKKRGRDGALQSGTRPTDGAFCGARRAPSWCQVINAARAMAQTDSSPVQGVQEFVPDKLSMLGLQRIQLNKRSFVLNHPLYPLHSVLLIIFTSGSVEINLYIFSKSLYIRYPDSNKLNMKSSLSFSTFSKMIVHSRLYQSNFSWDVLIK